MEFAKAESPEWVSFASFSTSTRYNLSVSDSACGTFSCAGAPMVGMVGSTDAPNGDELCLSPGTRPTAAAGLSLPGCATRRAREVQRVCRLAQLT